MKTINIDFILCFPNLAPLRLGERSIRFPVNTTEARSTRRSDYVQTIDKQFSPPNFASSAFSALNIFMESRNNLTANTARPCRESAPPASATARRAP